VPVTGSSYSGGSTCPIPPRAKRPLSPPTTSRLSMERLGLSRRRHANSRFGRKLRRRAETLTTYSRTTNGPRHREPLSWTRRAWRGARASCGGEFSTDDTERAGDNRHCSRERTGHPSPLRVLIPRRSRLNLRLAVSRPGVVPNDWRRGGLPREVSAGRAKRPVAAATRLVIPLLAPRDASSLWAMAVPAAPAERPAVLGERPAEQGAGFARVFG